ncbi:E3 ubiquitin-protein ligase TRIM71-like [Dysidea avara]|uniref:E3 ubiquitin-protein ligase TRIM71-like n=1 Tax=Dysidea avara TaxID=196820 RepID=UPI003319F13A
MDVKRATENLSCPVCYQLFKNPKYLPCYHSYCEECLEKMVLQYRITCPECRQETMIPEGGVKNLANNFFINRMVDELVLKRKVEGEEEVKCDVCDEDDPVVVYCIDCSLFQCQFCHEAHKRDKRSRGHNMIPLAELKSTKDLPLQAKVNIPLCKDHDEQLKYYCETCEQLVCMYCTVKGHTGHSHDTVKKIAETHRRRLSEVTAPVEDIIRGLSEARNNIDIMKNKLKEQGDEVNRTIDQYYDNLVQKLMEQKKLLKQRVHDMVSQNEKVMSAQLDQVEFTQAEVLSVKQLKDTMQKSSDQELMSAKNQVTHAMQRITVNYKQLNAQLVQSDTVAFVPTEITFPQFGQVFTRTTDINPCISTAANLPRSSLVWQKVQFVIKTYSCSGSRCTKGGSKILLQFESVSVEVTAAQVVDNDDGSYIASFVATKPGKLKIIVSINGEQIKGSPFIISVCRNYSSVSEPSKILNIDGSMGEMWGVAFGVGGIWAATDFSNHCVYIFDNHDQLIRKFGGLGSSNGQFTNPCGITFDSKNFLYVADCANHRVQKFNVQGNYLLHFGTKGSANGQLNFPVGVVVRNDKLYISEQDNHRISVFYCDGRFWQVISRKRIPVKLPYDLTFSNNHQLFVVDYSLHCVHSYSPNTQKAVKFGTEGSKWGQLKDPCSLVTDESGLILVADTGNHRVSIFDEDGSCVHCFGSLGLDDGQFSRPRGIALSPNGSIYVSDSRNNRIQVFTSC